MKKRKIGAKVVFPVAGEPVRNGVVAFDETGRVVAVSENDGTEPDVEYHDGILVPGFVNTHSHLELSYMKGVLPQGAKLGGFVKQIMESKFTFPEEVQRKAIARADQDLWESGVQAIGDISNTTVSFDTKKESPVKYVTYAEIFDFMANMSPEAAMRQGEELTGAAHRMDLEAYVTLHATYSVSDKLFRAWAGMKHSECLSIHYRESPDDDLLFGKKGLFWDYFQEKNFELDFLPDGSSTNRILNNIPSDRRVLLVHNSNVTTEDIERMTAKYERLSWALCPMSNLYIEGKLPPVDLLRKHGLNLTIGTDSLSSNTELSMVAEMRAMAGAFHIPFGEIIRWATLNGAKALELDREIGSFETGKRPGAVLIEGLDDELKFTAETRSKRLI